ncbi:MAG: response regulator [Alphaproteobacteria bacterium]
MTRKILAVDDSRTMRDMVAFTLKGAGFDVVEAEDGVDALSKVPGNAFDLIITDVNMPNMDGITLIRKLREEDACKGTPILILTTESEETKRQEGRSAGATGWIVKPFDPDKLLQVVSKVCQ